MRPKNLLFIALTLPFFGLGGCAAPETRLQAEPQVYFDVPGFINAQIAILEKEPVALQKTVGFGQEKPETGTITQVDWNKELALFREIDLNKKALKGLYTETRTQLPAGEKLRYTRQPDADVPFAFVEISRNQNQQVTALRAVYEQENGLFFNREERFLTTSPNGQLQAYQIDGVQKVRFFDSLNYTINSRLP